MSSEIECPNCGETDDLSGQPKPMPDDETDLIAITCGACGLQWDRDPRPSCPTCGSTEVRAAAQAVLDKSRGTQLSVQFMTVIHLCPHCEPERVADYLQSNVALPPDDLPINPKD